MSKKSIFQRDNSGTSIGTAMGIGLAAAAAAAGVTYFLYGTEKGEEKRKVIKKWAKNVKSGAEDMAGDLAKTTKEAYSEMSYLFKDKYEDLKDASKEEIAEIKEKIKEKKMELEDELNVAIDNIKKRREAEFDTEEEELTK